MRALHICWSYPSELLPADGSFFRNQVEGLRDAGVEVTVAVPVPYVPRASAKLHRRFFRPALLPRTYEFKGIPVVVPRYARVPDCLPFSLASRMMARAIAKSVTAEFDLIHAHFAYPYGCVGLILARQWRIPMVLSIHGSDGHTDPYRSEEHLRRFRHAVLGADCVLAVSNDLVNRVYSLTGKRARLWPIGVDMSCFRPFGRRQSARRQLGIPENQQIVLFVGALIPDKGVDKLVAAMESLDGAQALFVGEGPLCKLVKSSARCTWVPPISNEQVPVYLAAADVMVLPTLAEGMPTVLVEAGAVGVPVVSTAVSSIPDLLADDRGLLVPFGDVPALTAALRYVLNNPESSAQRAERFRQYLVEHYDCKKNAARLAEVYQDLVAQLGHAKTEAGPLAGRREVTLANNSFPIRASGNRP
jgi:teichuronic acid biosynthesis glycosyltransferase TuaC